MSIWSDFLTNSIYSEGPSCLWQFVGIRGETCLAPRFIKVSDVASLQKGCAYKDLVKCWQCNFGTRRFYIYIYICICQLNRTSQLTADSEWMMAGSFHRHIALNYVGSADRFQNYVKQESHKVSTTSQSSPKYIARVLVGREVASNAAATASRLWVRCTEQTLSWFWIVDPKLQSTHLTTHKLGLICLAQPALAVTTVVVCFFGLWSGCTQRL